MPGRKPLLENELPRVYAALADFPLRDQALFILGLNSGFRVSELLSLDVGDVHQDGRSKPFIRVNRAQLKGGKGVRKKGVTSRSVPLNSAAASALERYIAGRFKSAPIDPAAPLFPSRFHDVRLTRWGANSLIHKILRKAGLPNQEWYGTHTLRKTFCRAIYQTTSHDLNLTRAVMGHSNVSTTQRYLHVDESEIENAVLSLARPTPIPTFPLPIPALPISA